MKLCKIYDVIIKDLIKYLREKSAPSPPKLE